MDEEDKYKNRLNGRHDGLISALISLRGYKAGSRRRKGNVVLNELESHIQSQLDTVKDELNT